MSATAVSKRMLRELSTSYIVPYDEPGFVEITTAQAEKLQEKGLLRQLGTVQDGDDFKPVFTRPIRHGTRFAGEMVRCYLKE